MPILVSCPCGKTYNVRDEFAGQELRCSLCGCVFIVPRSAPLPIAPAPQPPAESFSWSSLPLQPRPRSSKAPLVIACFLVCLLAGGSLAILLNLEALEELINPKADRQARGEPAPDEDKQAEKAESRKPKSEEDDRPKPPPEKKPEERPEPNPPEQKPEPKPPEPQPASKHPPFAGHGSPILRVAFSADGRLTLSASGGIAEDGDRKLPAADSSLRTWDAATGQLQKHLKNFPDGIATAAFSPDGRYALVAAAGQRVDGMWQAGADLDLHLWDLHEQREVRKLNGHRGEVLCIAFSADGKYALSGGRDRVIRMWEVQTGREVQRLVGHTNSVNSVAFTPDGRHALSGASDQTARFWELQRGIEVRQLPGHQDIVWAVAIANDGKLAATGGGFQAGPGGKLIDGGKDFAIRIWDLAEGKELRRLEGHTAPVSALAFSADGRRLLSGSVDKSVRLWQTSTGRPLGTFTGHTKFIQTVAVSPTSRLALSGGEDATLRAWELPPELADLVKLLGDGNDGRGAS
jgi:WD40 repeat protein